MPPMSSTEMMINMYTGKLMFGLDLSIATSHL